MTALTKHIIIAAMPLRRWSELILVMALLAAALGASSMLPGDPIERVRYFTRNVEFDYITWTLGAIEVKMDQEALGTSGYLSAANRHKAVVDSLDLVRQIESSETQLADIYADPNIGDPATVAQPLMATLADLYAQRRRLAPLAESVLQDQLAQILAEAGLTLGGQPAPPVLYRVTPLPLALIVSPRNKIQEDADISLVSDLTVDQQAALEGKVDKAMNVSSLVVGVGGIGVYPTMVMQTTDIEWQVNTIAHEWTHNYLTLRPLGVSYMDTPELRTMNETTASISGDELGHLLMERFYPELLPPPPENNPQATPPPAPSNESPPFDFRQEMHTTRVTVDGLLAQGKIGEAEAYMETRRTLFWDNGYHIRKINQAYFAFYGAYADQPGGAAGEDPVGAAVRKLRAQSPTLAAFINRISWMSSYQQLQQAVGLH